MTVKKGTKKGTASKKRAESKASTKSKTTTQEFPGYPKYSPAEDITQQARRVDSNLDDEVLTQVKHRKEPKADQATPDQPVPEAENEAISTPKNNFDVTEDDLEALGPKDLSMDMGDDEQLKHRTRPVDFAGNDLDVPGSELDDEGEETGSEDEENNSYSLGGDSKSNLDED